MEVAAPSDPSAPAKAAAGGEAHKIVTLPAPVTDVQLREALAPYKVSGGRRAEAGLRRWEEGPSARRHSRERPWGT